MDDLPDRDDPRMWRKLVKRVHPDVSNDHELYLWVMRMREERGMSEEEMKNEFFRRTGLSF